MSPSPLLRALAVLVASTAVALPAAGCGSSSSSSAGIGSGDPAASVPAAAPAYVEAVLHPARDQRANAQAILGRLLDTADPGAKLGQLLDDAGRRHGGIVFSRDIRPWLGDRAAVAVTALGDKAGAAQALIVVDTTDPKQTRAALDASARGLKRTYRGVGYSVSDGTAAAVVGDTVLLGDEPALKASLDVTEGGAPALADSAPFKRVRGSDGIGSLYLDVHAVLSSIAQRSSGTAATALQVLPGLAGGALSSPIGASLSASPKAIRIDGRQAGARRAAPAGGDGPAALAAAPADAWLAAGAGDVGGRLQQILDQLGRSGALGGLDPQLLLSQLKSQFGLDLQRDLLAWMGDASVWVSGRSRATLQAAVVITSKDPAASRRAIGKLRGVLALLTGTATPLKVPGGSGLSISSGSLGAPLQIAAAGDRFVVAYGRGALNKALHPHGRLGSTPAFAAVSAELGGERPSLYLDTPGLLRFAAPYAGTHAPPAAVTAALAHLGAIAFGSDAGQTGRFRGAIVVN